MRTVVSGFFLVREGSALCLNQIGEFFKLSLKFHVRNSNFLDGLGFGRPLNRGWRCAVLGEPFFSWLSLPLASEEVGEDARGCVGSFRRFIRSNKGLFDRALLLAKERGKCESCRQEAFQQFRGDRGNAPSTHSRKTTLLIINFLFLLYIHSKLQRYREFRVL